MPVILKTENDLYAEQFTLRTKKNRDRVKDVTPHSTLFARRKPEKTNNEVEVHEKQELEIA
ncbi:hypothetical protein SAMN04515695_2333 [Pseudovibrio sp. Tun.PSC04-5.I4]|nr:hypothetical protein SAMN04515695_2333 [Pseudovibrio sp. Tun.PSC04-5.I4]